MSDNVTHDDGMVSMPEEKHDALKASLSDAKEKADRVDDLEAALSEAEDERDDLQTQVEAMTPLVDTLQAALSEQTGLSDDFVNDMSPADIQDAYAGDLSDLLDDTAGDGETSDDGGAGGAVGSSGDGVSQTGATGGSSALSDDEQKQVAALEARAEHAENMDGDHWDAAAEVARDKIDAIKGDN
jgi:chromosome segregation ATPase